LRIRGPLIAGKKRDRVIRDPRDLLEPSIGRRLIMSANDKPQDQTPNRRKSQPHPGITIGVRVFFRDEQVFFFGMNKAP
jgi:hypothetical protein